MLFVQETLPDYRVPLFSAIVERGALAHMQVRIAHGVAEGERGRRLSTGSLASATRLTNRYLPVVGHQPLVWQPALRLALRSDLVIVEQANRMLLNYVLLVLQHLGGPKVAFWGHGRNWQSTIGDRSRLERFKAWLARRPYWWFAYTGGVEKYLVHLGVDPGRITSVENTVDEDSLRAEVDSARQAAPDTGERRICTYLGGLYHHKRLDFLVEACDVIRSRVPDFELQVAGDGEERQWLEEAMSTRPWITYSGPVSGPAKASLLARSELLLVPGLVGLVILDGFAAGLPLVTTADALHSPEVDYLTPDVNGIMLPPGTTTASYAAAVVQILRDPQRSSDLSTAARAEGERHSIANSASRFVDGMAAALALASARA